MLNFRCLECPRNVLQFPVPRSRAVSLAQLILVPGRSVLQVDASDDNISDILCYTSAAVQTYAVSDNTIVGIRAVL